jgi:hypothetical protein
MPKTFEPQTVTGAERAFGGGDKIPYGDWEGSDFMPSGDDIPAEFHEFRGTKWNKLFSEWFFNGLPADAEFVPNKGIDSERAFNHIATIMSSWTPKHEHKEAACAYLMSLWFKDVRSGGKSLLKK